MTTENVAAFGIAALEDYRKLMLEGRDSYDAKEIDHIDSVIESMQEFFSRLADVRAATYILIHQDTHHAESLALVNTWLDGL